jgi:hypothetical protein
MQINVSLAPIKCKQKPQTKKEITFINKSFITTGLTITELIEYSSEPYSYTITPAIFNENKRNKSKWKEQQLIMLDFDGGIYPNEVIAKFHEYGITPNYYYHTMSHSDLIPKFRIALVLDKPFTDKKEITELLKSFKHVFPQVDSNCLELSRMFFGGTCSNHLTDELVTQEKLLQMLYPYIISNDSNKTRKVVQKRVCLYNYNRDTRFQTDFVFSNYLCYLKSLKDNNIDFDEIYNNVKIFQDFIDGKWLYHPQLFGIATNLAWLKGGAKLFNDTLRINNEKGLTNYGDEKFSIMTYVKHQEYYPQRLADFSPYPEDHQYSNIITSVRRPIGRIEVLDQPELISLDEGVKLFNQEIEKAINDESDAIYIFKLPTGFGKTEYLTKLNEVCIAFPTHQLKDEVAGRMKVEYDVLPNPPVFHSNDLNNYIQKLYKLGLKVEVNKLMKLVSSNANAEYSTDDMLIANNYFIELEKVKSSKNTVLLTHARAVESSTNKELIIYDEDPIKELLSMGLFYLTDLMLANSELRNSSITDFISFASSITVGEVGAVPSIPFDEEALAHTLMRLDMKSDIFSLMNADYFVVDKQDKNKVHYVRLNELPAKKTIIMSASPQLKLYQGLYGDRIKVIDLTNIKIAGQIIQHTDHSYSRSSLDDKLIEALRSKLGDKQVITFQKIKQKLSDNYPNMHFGNTQGYDSLNGQNIAVVGTPHINDVVYKLYARVIGFDVNETCDLQTRLLEHNGFRFYFKTFENDDLREIQLQMIESELIQAVGRARVLRNDCIIEVYSNLPLQQANFSEQII